MLLKIFMGRCASFVIKIKENFKLKNILDHEFLPKNVVNAVRRKEVRNEFTEFLYNKNILDFLIFSNCGN